MELIEFINIEKNKIYFKNLMEKVENEYKKSIVYPNKSDIFSSLKGIYLDNLKIVIIGQDPYHGKNQADGMAFSTKSNKLPPSLKNIYKEIERDFNIKLYNNNGNLSYLKEQGVLLLNEILTVKEGEPMSHKDIGWQEFTNNLIKFIDSKKDNVVYMLFGNIAKSKEKLINNKNTLVLKTTHPSPFSYQKGFKEAGIFKLANEYLKKNNICEINYQNQKRINIIGAGLAGCEAANFLANKKIYVNLYDQKPSKKSPAHINDNFSELVCSNSLKSSSLKNACGILKKEIEELDSIIIEASNISRVPGGSSLCVDREIFSKYITNKIKENKYINIIEEEVKYIDDDSINIIATGPLTGNDLFSNLTKLIGSNDLYFYDAQAPIIKYDSIDLTHAYFKDRYDKGDPDYLNLPLTEDEFLRFYDYLINAKTYPLKDFELKVFDGCMPIEVMAKRGQKTLLYGPMKPVGLKMPNGEKPYAVIQFRQDDVEKTLYSPVGFQTNLLFNEQKELLKLVKGLENVVIVKHGRMHKNTYINSPACLSKQLNLKSNPNIFFVGQITGVEGYVESAATGIIGAINVYLMIKNKSMLELNKKTIIGSLIEYITCPNDNFQPMNSNFSIVEPAPIETKDKDLKKEYIYNRCMNEIKKIKEIIDK